VITLEHFERPGTQVRAAMCRYQPYSYGVQMLAPAIPEWSRQSPDVVALLHRAFVDMKLPGVNRLIDEAASTRAACESLLRAHALCTLTRLQQRLFSTRLAFFIRKAKLPLLEAIAYANAIDVRHAVNQLCETFRIGEPQDLGRWTFAEILSRA
jgi:hypothetical protein